MDWASLGVFGAALAGVCGVFVLGLAFLDLRKSLGQERKAILPVNKQSKFSTFLAETMPAYTARNWGRRGSDAFITVVRTVLAPAGAAAALGLTLFILTGVPALGIVGAAAGAGLPHSLKKAAENRRAERIRAAWPDACRHLVANLQAGDSLPHAITSLQESGPAELRPYFSRFSRRYTATGDFENSLEALGAELSFAGVQRNLAALSLAHRSGGPELVKVLKTAAELASQKLATERDIAARQAWTITAARVSVVAPWVILLLLSLRPATAAVFSTALGTKVVIGGALATATGYWLMLRIGKVPR